MTCVKVPYNLAKFHTVKFLKNFNVKIFSRQENFMKFSITTRVRFTLAGAEVTSKRARRSEQIVSTDPSTCTHYTPVINYG